MILDNSKYVATDPAKSVNTNLRSHVTVLSRFSRGRALRRSPGPSPSPRILGAITERHGYVQLFCVLVCVAVVSNETYVCGFIIFGLTARGIG